MINPKKSNKKNKNTIHPSGKSKMYWIYGAIALIFLVIRFGGFNQLEEISENQLLNKVRNEEVKKLPSLQMQIQYLLRLNLKATQVVEPNSNIYSVAKYKKRKS